MMSVVVGLGNVGIGLAYAGLGLLSAWETISLNRYRGWSRFGIGFSLMAASCGPHHLVHGWHVLQGGSVTWPMLAATLIGLPAGVIFVWLRFETMWGGQGERLVVTSHPQAVALAGGFAVVAGCLAASAIVLPAVAQPLQAPLQGPLQAPLQAMCTAADAVTRAATAAGIGSAGFLANLFVTLTYGMVGWYLADHQVRRRLTTGAWSLSGVALTGVFFTCAQMHVVDAMAEGNGLMLFFDLIGIPASIYFLWVVKQLHNDSMLDWNRRPLVGVAAAPARPSPWSL